MQTRIGYALSLIVLGIATILAWTGNRTGWFRSDEIPNVNWGYLVLATLVALGAVRLFDRIHWVAVVRNRRAAKKAHRVAVRSFWTQVQAMSLAGIQESLGIGPYASEETAEMPSVKPEASAESAQAAVV